MPSSPSRTKPEAGRFGFRMWLGFIYAMLAFSVGVMLFSLAGMIVFLTEGRFGGAASWLFMALSCAYFWMTVGRRVIRDFRRERDRALAKKLERNLFVEP